MMREIKFRAWNGKFMESDFYLHSEGKVFDQAAKTYDTPNLEIESVDGMTLMQFTGLRDKNGKEIYEGDVCRNSYFVIYPENGFSTPLFWESRRAGFCLWSSIDNKDPESFCILNDRVAERLEVIGNIYETPELLK